MHLEKTEITSYSILLLGVSIDQLSTRVGISRYGLIESNAWARIFLDFSVWGIMDLLICFALIGVSYFSYRKILGMKSNLVFIFPSISGIFRIIAGIMNISIL